MFLCFSLDSLLHFKNSWSILDIYFAFRNSHSRVTVWEMNYRGHPPIYSVDENHYYEKWSEKFSVSCRALQNFISNWISSVFCGHEKKSLKGISALAIFVNSIILRFYFIEICNFKIFLIIEKVYICSVHSFPDHVAAIKFRFVKGRFRIESFQPKNRHRNENQNCTIFKHLVFSLFLFPPRILFLENPLRLNVNDLAIELHGLP